MRKRIILIVLALLLIVGGGVGAYFLFFAPKTNPVAQLFSTPEDTAKDFFAHLTAKKTDDAYNLLSSDLRNGYSREYWNDEVFSRFADYKEAITLVKKTELKPNGTQPASYPENLEPVQLEYDAKFSDLTYRVTMVLIKQDGRWQINELKGAYLPRA